MIPTPESTIGELVRALPGRARLFEKLGIDYCCGGKKSLTEACRGKGLDPATVAVMLQAFDALPTESTVDAERMEPAELCDHIVGTHHQYLREELPRLDHMTRRVAAVHGADEPRLIEIRQVFEKLQAEMLLHMRDEEEIVFPAIKALAAGESGQGSALEALRTGMDQLEAEHAEAGAALGKFRELTQGFVPPNHACNTYRALFHSLADLERNMHQHVHKENNVLFPKALALVS